MYYKVTEHVNGDKEWHLNGKRHREDGPAVELSDGSKYWFLRGKCHREDGPAVELSDGTKEWYLHGEPLTEAEFKLHQAKQAPPPTVELPTNTNWDIL